MSTITCRQAVAEYFSALRTMNVDKDDIWSFSPFIDQSIFRLIKRNLPRQRLFDWQIMFFWTVVALRFVQTELARYLPGSILAREGKRPQDIRPQGRNR